MSETTFTERQHLEFSMIYLIEMLETNGKNIDDPEFLHIVDRLGNIVVMQNIDVYLHTDMYNSMVETHGVDLMVLWKKPFPDAKMGDIINNGEVVGIFDFTIWIRPENNYNHEFCCPTECCSCLEPAEDSEA